MILNYRVVGTGKAIVLIHGLFGSRDNLQSLGHQLSDRYSVVTVDLRNHGESPRSSSMSLQEMALDICETMSSLGFESFAMVGHSLGGKVAMMTALLHPHRVSALVVADIAPTSYGQNRHNDVFRALQGLPLASLKTRGEASQYMRDHLHEPDIAEFLLKGLRKAPECGFELRYNVPVLMDQYANIAGWPSIDGIYDGPVRFIRGAGSDYVTTEHAPAIQRYFPNASVRSIEGAGHWLHAQKPAAFNRLVERFLDEN